MEVLDGGDSRPAEHARASALSRRSQNARSSRRCGGCGAGEVPSPILACAVMVDARDWSPPAPLLGPWGLRKRSGEGQRAPRGAAAELGSGGIGTG